MDFRKILSCTDHTLLSQSATFEQIKQLCDEGIEYGVASVCIPACFVKKAKEYVGDKLKICTVVGFPNGYSTTNAKCFETTEAVISGADEIDMVINISYVKEGRFDDVLKEIKEVKKAACDKVLKVIVETCLLTCEEKVRMCQIVSQSGAQYIKTSTGFSLAGASAEDIKLFSKNISNNLKIKAAGGISSLEDAEEFISLGASRLGSSKIIKLYKEYEGRGAENVQEDSSY